MFGRSYKPLSTKFTAISGRRLPCTSTKRTGIALGLLILEESVVGMVLTNHEWISDLWVLRPARGEGIGRRLLERGETEIANRGHLTFRLRVVKSNTSAVRFYQRNGWQVDREFHHEKLPVTMIEMIKHDPANDSVV